MTMTLTANGVSLDQPGRWRLMDGTSKWTSPPDREPVGVAVPFRPGVIPVLWNMPGPQPFRMVLDVYGADHWGTQANLDELVRLFGPATTPLTLARSIPGGPEDRTATAEVLTVTTDDLGPDGIATVNVLAHLTEGMWRGTVQRSTVLPAGNGQAVPDWLGTAPVFDPTISFAPTGATTNVRVTDDASGSWVSLVGDAGTGLITMKPAEMTAWYSTRTNYSGLLDYSGLPFRVTPGGTISVSGAQVTIAGKRGYW